MKCSGVNSKGQPCKLTPTNGKYCRYHCVKTDEVSVSPKSKGSVETKKTIDVKKPVGTGVKMEENLRGIEKELCYDNLGVECELKPDTYYLAGSKWEKYKKEGSKPYPEKFSKVTKELLHVCEILEVKGGDCTVHPVMPGIQWANSDENVKKAKALFEESMHAKGNHYFHHLKTSENSAHSKEDKEYCMCEEWQKHRNAFLTLKGRTEEEWKHDHGSVLNAEGNIVERPITPSLKTKIINDSIDYLAQEYKIHLQVKPEYQIPVLHELVDLLKEDKELFGIIYAWKAIIPYDRVISGMMLPSIVVYPVFGKANAELALKKIMSRFSGFDIAQIGLNVTPRFNRKFNEMVYVAGGSGDHKYFLDEKYFDGKEKNFYKGYEITL